MAKFIRGPFRTVEDVKAEVRTLRDEGYRDQDITIVASRKEDIRTLDEETPLQVMDNDAQSVSRETEVPFWQQLTDAFTGNSFNYDYQDVSNEPGAVDEDPRTLLAGYRKNLENGEILLLVDDSLLNKESRFNLDVLNENQAENTGDRPASEERNVDPTEVMEETIPEQDSHPDIEDTEEVLGQETPYVPGDAPAGKSASDLLEEAEHAPDGEADTGDRVRSRTYVPDSVPTDDPDINAEDLVDMPEDNRAYSQPDSVPEDRSGLPDADPLTEDADNSPGFYRKNLAVDEDDDFPEVIDADRDSLITYDPDGDDEDPLRRK